MFEIYRDTTYGGKHDAVYYTELGEAQKSAAINRATAGEHVYDGFIQEWRSDDAKALIKQICTELDDGAELSELDIATRLSEFTPAE